MATAVAISHGGDVDTTKTVTRRQLYELVWTTPMRTLAKEFGMSDVGLAKVCRRYDIPRPPPGYWAKLQAGKKVKRPQLRESKDLDGLTITFDLRKHDSTDEANEPRPVHRDQDVADAIALVEKNLPIQVDDQATRHRFVVSTERALHQSLRSKQRDRDGLVHPWWEFRGPKLAIGVAESSIQRALRIADALLRGALASGIQVVSVAENDRERITFTVLKESFQFSISERRRQVPHVLTQEEKEQERKYGRPLWAPKIDYVGQATWCCRSGPTLTPIWG
jgi:hypothetical protein